MSEVLAYTQRGRHLTFYCLNSFPYREAQRWIFSVGFSWIHRVSVPTTLHHGLHPKQKSVNKQNRWTWLKVWIFSNSNMLLTAHVPSFRNSSWILSAGANDGFHITLITPLFSSQPKQVQNIDTLQWACETDNGWLINAGWNNDFSLVQLCHWKVLEMKRKHCPHWFWHRLIYMLYKF